VTRLRLVAFKELRKLVETVGFKWVRREGSHNVFRNAEGRIIVIPDHGFPSNRPPLTQNSEKSCATPG